MLSHHSQQALAARLDAANSKIPEGLKPWPPFTPAERTVCSDVINGIDIADHQLTFGMPLLAESTYAWQVEFPLRCMLAGHFNPRREARSLEDGFLEAPSIADEDVAQLEVLLQPHLNMPHLTVEGVAAELAALSRVVDAFLAMEPDSAPLQLAGAVCQEVACFQNTARNMEKRGALSEATAQAMLQAMRDLTARVAYQVRAVGDFENP